MGYLNHCHCSLEFSQTLYDHLKTLLLVLKLGVLLSIGLVLVALKGRYRHAHMNVHILLVFQGFLIINGPPALLIQRSGFRLCLGHIVNSWKTVSERLS